MLVCGLLGCGDPPVFRVEIVLGHETDALSRAPAVTRVDVVARSVTSSFTASASAAPGESFDLGEIATDELIEIEATGVTADGQAVVRGRSLSGIRMFGSEQGALPLFVQRTDGWARPPGELVRSHAGAPGIGLAERYVLVAGGTVAGGGDPGLLDAYDLLLYGGAPSADALPRVPASIVARGSAVLCIDEGGATWVDLSTAETAEAQLPPGLASFADVAGGRVIDAPGDLSYVVGATRDPDRGGSAAVLRVAADGTLSALALGSPRAGAAAVWVSDLGLVVAGGSAEAPGAEVLREGATAFDAVDLAPDPVAGAALVPTSSLEIVRAGGRAPDGSPAPGAAFDPRCRARCEASLFPDLALGAPSTRAWAYSTGPDRGVLVMEADPAGGGTLAFALDLASPSATPLPLREPRRGATPVPAPNGTLALLGGEHLDGTPARTVEILWVER